MHSTGKYVVAAGGGGCGGSGGGCGALKEVEG